MIENNAVVAIYKSHVEAEAAVKGLQHSGFDMKKLSIVGPHSHTDEHVTGYYNTFNNWRWCKPPGSRDQQEVGDYNSSDRVKFWGETGAFWGGIWGLLFGSAFFLIPGIGPLLVAGPLVGGIVAVLEDAVVVGGLSALGAGLYNLGIPKNNIPEYETALKSGKFVVIAHGTEEEATRAREIIARTQAEAVKEHPLSRTSVESYVVGA